MTFGEISGVRLPELDWSIGGDQIYWDPVPWIPHLEEQRGPRGWLILNASSVFGHNLDTWEERNWRNVPGPIYAAGTDNTGVGPATAPRHFLHGDDHDYGSEFLYRQPRSLGELRDVVAGADQDTWAGWACDGDEHWNYPVVREWWRARARVEQWIDLATAQEIAREQRVRLIAEDEIRLAVEAERVRALESLDDYRKYLRGDLEAHLRAYSFWLEERREPTAGDPLPDL